MHGSSDRLRRSIVNMLGGNIQVRSEVRKGTEVRVTLPMMRSYSSETPVSTPGSSSTLDRRQDDSITTLQERAKDTKVALYGFTTHPEGSEPSQSMSVNLQVEKSLSMYITDWYSLAVTASLDLSPANIIIIDEDQLSALRATYLTSPEARAGTALVCLCTNTTRHGQSCSWEGGSGIIEFVSKPFGPYKLAKALRVCLDKLHNPTQGTQPSQVGVERTEQSSDSNLESILSGLEKVTFETDDENTPINIQDDGKVRANGESTDARLAIGVGSIDGKEFPESRTDYPFPHIGDPLPHDDTTTTLSEERNLPRQETVLKIPHIDANRAAAVSSRGETTSTSKPSKESPSECESRQEKPPPRILLVDDNKINLRLLQTYMRKRHYSLVDSADDGGEAVRSFRQSDGYDIIFMGTLPLLRLLFFLLLLAAVTHQSTTRHLHARPKRLRSHARDSADRGRAADPISREEPSSGAHHRLDRLGVGEGSVGGVHERGRSLHDEAGVVQGGGEIVG
jgi:hypothetical protein